jgi:GAF domain
LNRYDPDDTETVLGAWSSTGCAPVAVGTRVRLGGRNVSSLVFGSGRPVRIDDYADVSGAVGDVAREVGVRASVGVPISVAGRLWGVVLVVTRSDPLPADTEARLAGFTELVATALANAEAQAALVQRQRSTEVSWSTTRSGTGEHHVGDESLDPGIDHQRVLGAQPARGQVQVDAGGLDRAAVRVGHGGGGTPCSGKRGRSAASDGPDTGRGRNRPVSNAEVTTRATPRKSQ